MPYRTLVPALLLCLACSIGAAHAQSTPPTPGGLKKGGAPDISKISAGNAAGLLGFCVKHKYLPASSADPVVNGLVKKPGARSSSGYAAGQKGQIVNGSDKPVAMTEIPHEFQGRACNALLKKGRSLM
jgi:uncharacterized protein DUF2501